MGLFINIDPNVDVHINGGAHNKDIETTYNNVVLKCHLVDGRSVLTQEMIDACGENTIFTVKYNFNIDDTITLPDNCVLKFEGGSFVGGTVVGNNTKVFNPYEAEVFNGTVKQGSFVDLSAVDWEEVSNKPSFATVATTGSYNDLTDKPVIPTGQVQSDWNQTSTSAVDYIKNKPTKLSDFADDSSFVDGASYDGQAKRINLKHNDTVVAWIDAAPFIIDGMVSDVKIENGKLVIKFNTDAGKQDIEIPLTDIFNPNNYYTKAQVDTELGKKANTSSLANVATSGNYNDLSNKPAIPVVPTKVSAFTNDAGYLTQHQDISSKQDKLVSGQNIKTINNQSLLGSGNIDIQEGGDYLPLTGGQLTGDLTVYNSDEYIVKVAGKTATTTSLDGGSITIETATSGTPIKMKSHLDYNELYFSAQDVKGTSITNSSVTSGSFIKSGGTATQFLKADGSIDNTAYLTSNDLSNYLDVTSEVGRTVSGKLILNGGATIPSFEKLEILGDVESVKGFKKKDSSDDYVLLAGGGTKALSEIEPSEFNCVTIDSKQTITGEKWFRGDVSFLDDSSVTVYNNIKVGEGTSYTSIMPWRIKLSHIISPSPQKTAETILDAEGITSPKFIVKGGSAAQFLKADGSVDNNSYALVSSLGNYLPLDGGTLTGAVNFTNTYGNGSIFVDSVDYDLNITASNMIYLDAEHGVGVNGKITANTFEKSGGTSAQFLKADGSVDENAYNPTNNFKTINGNSIIGTGNIVIEGGGGTVSQIKVGNTPYNPADGVVSLPAYPTSLPASDVYSWAKASTKPSYSLDEISDGSTRKLSNYLPLTGGILTGTLTVNNDFVAQTIQSDGIITATQFKKSNGTSSQFLKADGSVDGNSYALASSLSSYLPLTGGSLTGNLDLGGNTLEMNVGDYSSSLSSNRLTFSHTEGSASISMTSTDKFLSLTGGKILLNGVDSSTFLTSASLDDYATQSWVQQRGYLTSSSLNGYATQSWVQQQGYASSSALSSYLPLTGGTISGDLTVSGNVVATAYTVNIKHLYLVSGGLIQMVDRNGDNSTKMGFDSNNVLYLNKGMKFGGSVEATGFVNTSDETLKNKIGDVALSAEDIANAPSIKFTWKDEKKSQEVNVGTIAQYWQEVLPEVVSKDKDDKLGLNYSALATVSVISLAKEVVGLREKVSTLEERLAKLEQLMTNK